MNSEQLSTGHLSADQLSAAYCRMLELRLLDEMLLELKMRDLIMDGFHPYQGEEAVAIGVGLWLRPEDVVISNHRPQGHAFAKGTTSRQILAEFLGRQGGPSDGIGGPMQFIDAPNNFYCGSIVGSGMTVAAGVGLAIKQGGLDGIAVCFFGDGASNTGSFHEALNLAAIWRLPVLYVCENNQYGEAMPVSEFVSGLPISNRAQSYGLKGVTVDGMDVEAVAQAAQQEIARVRAGEGPAFIEAVTYRYKGHYGGDPEHTYRTREEVERWRDRDPLVKARARLVADGASGSDLAAMERELKAKLQADQAWALEQRFLTIEEATDHVLISLAVPA